MRKIVIRALSFFKGPVFKTVIFNGCYFHFVQNLWKNVQKKKLVNNYNKDKTFRKAFRQLECLAFVPPKDVIHAFKYISSNAPNSFKEMLTYFEKYYIGNLKRGSQNQRKIPMFPIKIWSVYNRVLAGEPRTNNSLEAWHKQFEVKIYCIFKISFKIKFLINFKG